MTRLSGKVALVTGGARGIGRAIVERFAAEGARVMIADIVEDEGKALADALPDAMFHALDVSKSADWDAAIAALQARFGPLGVLVNNAGTSMSGSIADAPEADWHRIMDINALGTFLGCQRAVRAMGAHGGSIINVASSRGQRPSSGQAIYSASKAAVLSLTRSVALHCGENGLPIRCNALCPGVIETPLLRQHMASLGDEAAARVQLGAMQVMNRIGQPEEIAAAALFLASDEASFVTGAELNADGGFRIRD
jgi:NAD(P)-dependent dehydrogenase (short-subunit alcohol dehydrogenase family)